MTRPCRWTSARTYHGSDVIVAVDDSPDVVAVIPTLGRDAARLGHCVAALRSQDSALRLAVVIVLNSPEHDAPELDGMGDCTVLRPGLNLGWAGGLQLGRHVGPLRGRLWLVQDDMTVEPTCLAALAARLDADPRLAIAAPVVVDEYDRVVAGSCGGVLQREPEIAMDRWYPREPIPVEELEGLDLLDYVPSRGMLVELSAWDAVGGMFPGYYPVLWADVDLCTAMRATDRDFTIVGEARVRHEGQGSTPGPYGAFLFHRHRRLYSSRWAGGASPAPAGGTPVPPALAITIATAAASLAADLAADRTRLIEVHDPLVAENSALRHDLDALHASRSWRITRPLRALGRLRRRR
jgi:GT2 family glycosyltransferase